MSDDWTDRLAGARMQVDQQFQDRVEASDFTNQEWGLIMTAVEFEVETADDPEAAELVADTSKVAEIMPELENIQREMGGAARPPGGGSSGDGILGRLRRAVGALSADDSGKSDDERLAEATALVGEYATALQSHLEARGRWEEICEAAQDA